MTYNVLMGTLNPTHSLTPRFIQLKASPLSMLMLTCHLLTLCNLTFCATMTFCNH